MGNMLVVRYKRSENGAADLPDSRTVVAALDSAYELRKAADEDKAREDPDGAVVARWTDASISDPANQAYVMTEQQPTLLVRTAKFSWWAEKPDASA